MDKKFIAALSFVLIFHIFFTSNVEYDHARNLKISQEFATIGLPSYFGVNFLANPPLPYIIQGIFIRLFGFHYFIHRMIDVFFWIGAMIILRKIGQENNIKNLEYLIGLSWVFIYASAIRNYSDILFFSALAFLNYYRLKKNPSTKNMLLFGSSFGLGLLVKYSFGLLSLIFIFDWTLSKKKLEKLIFSFLIAALFLMPLVYYANVNELAMPWVASTKGNVIWRPEIVQSLYEPYWILFKTWPVLSLFAIFSFFTTPITIMAFVIPFLGQVFGGIFELRHYFYIFIPLAIAASKFIDRKKWWRWVAIWYITSWVMFIPPSIHQTGQETSFLEFCESLTPSDTVLGSYYNYISVFSDGDGESSSEFTAQLALVYGADYFTSREVLSEFPLVLTGSFEIKNPTYEGTYYIYSISTPQLIASFGLVSEGEMKIVDVSGNPIYRAYCYVHTETENFAQVSNKAGEILLFHHPNQEIEKVECKALGFRQISSTKDVLTMEYVGIFHTYRGTRF